jgi:hypothetical protein
MSEQNVVEDAILEYEWAYFCYNNESPDGYIKVVERELDESSYDNDGYYDSGYPQGHEGQVFIVFEVNGKFWKKDGTNDSYGQRVWDGKFREVKKGEVMVTKYEWKEN